MAQITLEAWTNGGWHRFKVTFANARQALEYGQRKAKDEIWITETEELRITEAGRIGPYTADEMALLDYLYPQCHHGMSAELCMDPYGENHWGTRDQEMQGIL